MYANVGDDDSPADRVLGFRDVFGPVCINTSDIIAHTDQTTAMNVVITIPTYNERDNISRLIDRLQQVFRSVGHNMLILVVDDDSPDGTGEVVRETMTKFDNVFLLTGKKGGLGVAYSRGMTYAREQLGADVVFEMDADFSHKPEDVPRLIAEIDDGADMVIGSRYVKGGSIPEDWGLHRKLISKVGNIVGRYIAGIYKIRDCTAGFRAIRASLLRKIDLSHMTVRGYAFQVALLHEAVIRNADVREIPVEFVDRVHGESKLGLSDIVEFIYSVWWIRLQSSKTFIKFGIVGASGVGVNLAIFSLLLHWGVTKYVSSPVAIEVSIIWNFMLNNYWTFGHRRNTDKFHIKGLKFNIISVLSLVISYSTFVVLSLTFPATAPQVHQLAGIIPAVLINYFFNSYWTFRESQKVSR